MTSSTNITNTEPSTTSRTLPPGCYYGNLDERVCRLEDLNEEFGENLKSQGSLIVNIQEENERLNNVTSDLQNKIEDLVKEKEAMREDLEGQIEEQKLVTKELQDNLENQSKLFAASLKELENKILELSNRPCACR